MEHCMDGFPLPSWIFGLREYLQELVVRQEEKSWKEESLLLEIVVQSFLYELEETHALLQSLDHLVDLDDGHYSSVGVDGLHYVPPGLVDRAESSAFVGHLLLNVRRREDRLQVHPHSLDFEPLVENVLEQMKLTLPLPGSEIRVVNCLVYDTKLMTLETDGRSY